MKILILVPDGVGIRNYLYSDFILELNKRGIDVYVAHKVSKLAIKEIQENNKGNVTDYYELPDFKETILQRFLRETAAFTRIKFFKRQLNNPSILKFWTKKPKNLYEKIFYGVIIGLGNIFSKSYKFIRFVEKQYDSQITYSKAYSTSKEILKSIEPDLVLNLHQRAPITAPIIEASKKLDITTSTVIFSWDNIPKARLISRVTHYFVWSEFMKGQLLKLYPEISESNIFISGSPQFEFYFKDHFKLSKKEFFDAYNLDIDKKTICFSGDDALTSPYDQVYLEDLCKCILKMEKSQRPQILFRRCPVDFTNRFDDVLTKYNDLITSIKPDWRIEKETDQVVFNLIYPTFKDISLLVNTCLHSDVVVNLGSTMAHDFAVFDKPCLYLNYDPVPNSIKPVKTTYSYEHFKSMNEIDAVGWVKNSTDFSRKISEAIDTPTKIGAKRKVWLKKINTHPLEKNSEKLAILIKEKCM